MQGVIISQKCGKIDGKIIPANFAVIIGKQKNEKTTPKTHIIKKSKTNFMSKSAFKNSVKSNNAPNAKPRSAKATNPEAMKTPS